MKKKTPKNPRIRAKAWMLLEGIKQVDIQKELNYRHDTQVNETLQGVRNDRGVLRYLLKQGCPSHYLNLPTDMQEAV